MQLYSNGDVTNEGPQQLYRVCRDLQRMLDVHHFGNLAYINRNAVGLFTTEISFMLGGRLKLTLFITLLVRYSASKHFRADIGLYSF